MKTTLTFLALMTALFGQTATDTAVSASLNASGTNTQLFISNADTQKRLALYSQAKHLTISTGSGVIVINCETGAVKLPDGMSLPEAAAAFWKAVEQAFPRRKNGPHVHDWGKWSAPEISSHWYTGTRSYQQRTCNDCGHAEAQVVQISGSSK